MTFMFYLHCFLAGFAGILLHTLFKITALKKRANAANETFYIRNYLKNEWPSLSSSVVCVCIGIMIFQEIRDYKPFIANWVVTSFVFMGYMGNSILQALFSKSEKQILNVIDKKTNVADKALIGEEVTNEEQFQVYKAQANLNK
jgi:hypothetical protein